MADRKALTLLALLVLMTMLPFLSRAYFVDDFYFVTIARGIIDHPLRPYDFRSDDAVKGAIGWEKGQRPRMVNPVLFHYYLAGIMKLFGDASWTLRASTILFSLTSVASMYFLGKRFVREPLFPASLMAVTPDFWLTSYSLLIDSALIAFMLGSLWAFFASFDRRKTALVLVSGLLMGLTMLVKYVGALVLVLAFFWQMIDPKRRSWTAGYLAYPAAALVMLLWGLWNRATYGQMHFFAALPRGFHSSSPVGVVSLSFLLLSLATLSIGRDRRPKWIAGGFLLLSALILALGLGRSSSLTTWMATFYVDKLLVLASFLGGTFIFTWVSWWLMGIQNRTVGLGLLAFAVLLFYACHSFIGGFSISQSAEMAFFCMSTIAFLMLASRTLNVKTIEQRFILGWILLAILELILVMPWTAGRYLLVLLPPCCWAFASMLDPLATRRLAVFVWAGSFVLSAALAFADFSQANTIKKVAHELAGKVGEFDRLSDRPAHHWYYLSDTFDGSQPYLGPLGWENIFPYESLKPGDLLMRPLFRRSSWWKMDHPERFKRLMAFQFDSALPLRVMDIPASAGFYASCWGALPYSFTRDPLERFELFQVVGAGPSS